MIDLDLGGVASAGTPLPEQEYLFLIEEGSTKPAKVGDSTNLLLKLSVIEPAEHNGRLHNENINIQTKTLPFVKAFLTALLGVEDEELGQYQLNPEELAGQQIIGVIKHKEEDGAKYGNVIAWKHAG